MKTIGVLGGMGSYATQSIFKRLIDAFPAKKEWERPRILIDNNCTMPSRVRAILYGEHEDELIAEMSESIEHLAAAGADIIMIGCMTAHYFRSKLPYQDRLMNIPAETYRFLSEKYEKGTIVLCLCTEGSVETGIWTDALPEFIIKYPDDAEMKRLREFIEYVKQNKVTDRRKQEFSDYINEISDRVGAQCVVLGCTELPIIYNGDNTVADIVDPLAVAVDFIRNEVLR